MKLADRLRTALESPASALLLRGDAVVPGTEIRPAAVLIAVTERDEPGVILTVRRTDMRTHPGQVAFPGGRMDEGESIEAAALREAWEEIGLDPAAVDPIAALDPYVTITGYRVTPVLAIIPPDLPLAPHESEVADWFEAPLGHLLDPANHDLHSTLFEGHERHYYRIHWEGRNIWGATAAMLVNLSRRLNPS